MPLQIVYRLHQCFLKFQSKHEHQKQRLSKNGYLRVAQSLNRDMNNEIKALTALYFYNQKCINEFYSQTLKHPYFQRLELPFTLQEIISNMEINVNAVQSHTPQHCGTQQELQKVFREPILMRAPWLCQAPGPDGIRDKTPKCSPGFARPPIRAPFQPGRGWQGTLTPWHPSETAWPGL